MSLGLHFRPGPVTRQYLGQVTMIWDSMTQCHDENVELNYVQGFLNLSLFKKRFDNWLHLRLSGDFTFFFFSIGKKLYSNHMICSPQIMKNITTSGRFFLRLLISCLQMLEASFSLQGLRVTRCSEKAGTGGSAYAGMFLCSREESGPCVLVK